MSELKLRPPKTRFSETVKLWLKRLRKKKKSFLQGAKALSIEALYAGAEAPAS